MKGKLLIGFKLFLFLAFITTKAQVPPSDAANGTWMKFRGSSKNTGVQLMKGNYTSPPVKKWELITGDGAEGDPIIGDVDGDGDNDVVVTSQDNKIYALEGATGSILWTYTASTMIWGSPAMGDIDGDGDMDVVVGDGLGMMFALEGSTGTLLWSHNNGSNYYWGGPAIIDVDGDGDMDIVAAEGGGGNRVFAWEGSTGAVLWTYTASGPFYASPAVGDVDGDGDNDVVILGSDYNLYALDGATGSLLWSRLGSLDTWGSTPALGDLDGDGDMDVVVGGEMNLHAIEGSTGATLWTYPAFTRWASPAIADLDGDGNVEVIVAANSTFFPYKLYCVNGASGTLAWETVIDFIGGQNGASPKIADFDPSSPCLEILIATAYQPATNKVYLYSATGALLWNFNEPNHTYEGIAVGDIDNDGCVEMVLNPDWCAGTSSGATRTVIAVDDFGGASACGTYTGCSTLPIEIYTFTAKPTYNGNLLEWETLSEKNNDYFEVERKNSEANPPVFESIGVLNGAGSSDKLNSYQFTDDSPLHEMNYYRIKQVDHDGQTAYSKTVAVASPRADYIRSVNNFRTGSVELAIELREQETVHVLIYDTYGRLVLSSEFNYTYLGVHKKILDVRNLAKGMFTLHVKVGNKQQVQKFLISQ